MKKRIRRRIRRKSAPKVRRCPCKATQASREQARARMEPEGRLLVGGARDPAEAEADRMAARALSGEPAAPAASTGAGNVHRKCAACAAEDETDKTRRSPVAGPALAPGAAAAAAPKSAATAIAGMGPGRPLDKADRAFFEPRFGRDFSTVRVHDGPGADRAARAVDARAFANGNDIAFARGEREKGGRRLMAHELAHVAAEGPAPARRRLRRATLATADNAADSDYKAVPASHKKEVEAALKLIDTQAKAKKCKDYFKDNCSAGGGSLAKAIADSTVYWRDNNSKEFGASLTRNAAGDDRVVAYNTYAFNIGRYEIASTLLHEMFHTCILGSIPKEEEVAEGGVETCGFYSPFILGLKPGSLDVGDTLTLTGFSLGPTQDSDHYIEVGGVKITSYDSWDFIPGGSAIEVKFKIPSAVNENVWFAKDVEVAAYNHGTESNKRPLSVDP